ncbi:MAG: ABC transporter ATP-binding protein [Desulfurococcales archaeon]|nr:ABC transporter ATP-binding protein [Desulfurococcales archaeon]
MPVVARVEDLSVDYITLRGVVRVLNGVSIDVREGEILALVGETGSGKTTLGLSIPRLLPPNAVVRSGKILFDGVDVFKLSEDEVRELRGSKITVIFQEPRISLNPVMRIGDQLAEVLEAHVGIDKKTAYGRVEDMLRKVGLYDPQRVMKSYPFELSGGMAQRVMIAMAMLLSPRLIIADEPTSALDVTVQAQIIDLMKELISSYRTSVLYITHDLALVAEIADRVAVMYAGDIVEVGDVYDVFYNPLHPYTQGLLESIPKIGYRGKLRAMPGEVPSLLNPPPACRFHPRCPFVMDECRKVKPKAYKRGDHIVLCHLYKEEGK